MDPKAGIKVIEVTNVDRDIEVSKDFAARAFTVAKNHKWFNAPCESVLKMAFQGWKTLTCTGNGSRIMYLQLFRDRRSSHWASRCRPWRKPF